MNSETTKPRVFISGLGLVSSAGSDPETTWNAAYQKRSAIQRGLGSIDGFSHDEKPLALSLKSLDQCLLSSGWKGFNDDDGFIFATTTSLASSWDYRYVRDFRSLESSSDFRSHFRNEPLGVLLDQICEARKFWGKRLLVSSACAASTHAVALASDWIRSGRVKRCLVGATEVLSLLTIEGFKSFKLLSQEVCKPFDASRTGINLSEASAFICLETNPANPLGEVVGWGLSSDAHHMTAPHPEGKGSYLAMSQALKKAQISSNDLSWVHAHGTGSQLNDAAEGIAIQGILQGAEVPVSSTKAIHGHALGATGLLEVGLILKSFEKEILLPNTNFEKKDENFKIKVLTESLPTQIDYVLKNTMGFGGANGALVLKNTRGKR